MDCLDAIMNDEMPIIDDPERTLKKKKDIAIPWTDKHRPKKLDDVTQQEDVIEMLRDTLTSGNLPHLLFHGGPGTGKTSTILAIARELFGTRLMKGRVIELNASDDRGIGAVRQKIITFAKETIGSSDPRYPCPPFKLIILDEADAMTKEAQSALRKVMESYSHITRFCFICNYINQIIGPITSRCAKFRFKPLDPYAMKSRLKDISKLENMKLKSKVIDVVIEISHGDMRKGIMLLQNLNYISDVTITPKHAYEIANVIPVTYLKKIWKKYITNTDKELHDIINVVRKFMKEGFSVINVLEQISILVIYDDDLSDIIKADISFLIGKTEKLLIDGANEYIQLLNVCSTIHQRNKLEKI
jgi:replication factor C subunit 2/4